jgi:hypothetical protein
MPCWGLPWQTPTNDLGARDPHFPEPHPSRRHQLDTVAGFRCAREVPKIPISCVLLIATLAASCATAEDASTRPGVDAGNEGTSDGSGVGGADGGSPACTPGKQEACPCLGGAQGVQVCKYDGTGFSPCVCPDASAAGAGGDPGSGGTAGAGGAAGNPNTGGSPGSGGSSGKGGTGGSSGTGGSAGGGGATGNPDVCPGAVVTLPANFSDDTNKYTDDFHYMCGTGETGKDVAYQFVATSTTTVSVMVQPQGFSAVVAYSSNSCKPDAVTSCKWGVQVGATTTLQFPVDAGVTYWVFVDGYSLSGPFTISIAEN